MTEDEFILQGMIRLMPEPNEERMGAALARVRALADYLKSQGVGFEDRPAPRPRPERDGGQPGWDGLPRSAVAFALFHPAYRDAKKPEERTPEQEREEARRDLAHWQRMARMKPDDPGIQVTLEKARTRWEAAAGER